MTPQELADHLSADYMTLKLERASKPRHQTANHCHSAGHPCDRYLVLLRVAWQLQKPLDDPVKAAMFEEGHHQERALARDLEDLPGWRVAMRHTPVALPTLDLVGEIDLLLRHKDDPRFYVADIKSCSPGTFQSILNVEDCYGHRLWFVRQWPYQVLLYLEAALGDPRLQEHLHPTAGLLLLKDKTTGAIHIIVVHRDDDRVVWIRRRLWTVNERVERLQESISTLAPTEPLDLTYLRTALPPPIRDVHVCPSCAFNVFCSPDLFLPVGSAEVLDHPDLEHILEERWKRDETAKEWKDLDSDAKAILSQFHVKIGAHRKAYLLCGRFLITVSEIQPRGRSAYLKYDVWRRPDETQA
jgi:hypothetical protein